MQENDRQLVIQALGSLPAERFAVVDGAHFDDLPKELDIWQLEYKALYLEKLGETPSTAGPYLVTLPDWEAANRVLSLVGELPAVVFWSWGDGQPSLYKHLRRVNMIEIPVDDFDPELPKYDRVLFRHADPNVMASMLSVLDEGKFMHLLGGAAGLVMYAGDEGGLRVAQRISEMGADNQGLLRLSPEQYEALSQIRIEQSRIRICKYLRRTAPEQTKGKSDETLKKTVVLAEENCNKINLKSERAVAKWTYLEVITDGKILRQQGVKKYMLDGERSPDRKVDLLMRSLSASCKQLEKYPR